VDVWDLADRSHEPSTTFNVVGGASVTSLAMFSQQSTQLLAAGDDQGTLHVLEIPRNLRRAPSAEKTAIEQFFVREVERVHYVHQRLAEREKDAHDAADVAATAAAAEAQLDLAGAGEEGAEEDEFDAKAEEEYRNLEAAFREELGLDLPEGAPGAADETALAPPSRQQSNAPP